MTDAIGIWAYNSKIIWRTAASLVKYTQADIPIYILDHAPPHAREHKTFLRDVANSFGGRVIAEDCFVRDTRKYAPRSISRFLGNHPEIERLLKIDDDCIVACNLYDGVRQAYESRADTLFSAGISPIQIWGLSIIRERAGLSSKEIPDSLLDVETMYETLRKNPALVKQIWEHTSPPSKIRARLRQEPRFQAIPPTQRRYGMFHYFAHRDDILGFDGEWDEKYWRRLWIESARPRVMDTWSLLYHFAWCPWFDYAMREIWPLVSMMEF
jgi:hypothetical protein